MPPHERAVPSQVVGNPVGRGQPSASGTDRGLADDAAFGGAGTGTVVHEGVRTSEGAETIGTHGVATPPECSPGPRGGSTHRDHGPASRWDRWRPRDGWLRWDDVLVRARPGTA